MCLQSISLVKLEPINTKICDRFKMWLFSFSNACSIVPAPAPGLDACLSDSVSLAPACRCLQVAELAIHLFTVSLRLNILHKTRS